MLVCAAAMPGDDVSVPSLPAVEDMQGVQAVQQAAEAVQQSAEISSAVVAGALDFPQAWDTTAADAEWDANADGQELGQLTLDAAVYQSLDVTIRGHALT
jgi:hypothetical protein